MTVTAAGGRVWRALQAGLPAAATAAVAAWVLEHAGFNGWPVLGSALAAGCCTAAVWVWRAPPPRAAVLAWDGQCWTADGAPGRLQVMVDLGAWLLLRLSSESDGALHWVAVTRAEAGPAWHGLRAAVYSRPSPTAPRIRLPDRAAD